jgi:uncharacterized protein
MKKMSYQFWKSRRGRMAVVTLGLVTVAILLVLFFISYTNFKPNSSSSGFFLDRVEIADTVAEQELGLMNRRELCNTCGMLFVFDETRTQTFWMKNTLIPLDIIFINEEYKIINIADKTKPNQTVETYSSTKPARYVLELNQGDSKRFNLNTGDLINVKQMIARPYETKSNPK